MITKSNDMYKDFSMGRPKEEKPKEKKDNSKTQQVQKSKAVDLKESPSKLMNSTTHKFHHVKSSGYGKGVGKGSTSSSVQQTALKYNNNIQIQDDIEYIKKN